MRSAMRLAFGCTTCRCRRRRSGRRSMPGMCRWRPSSLRRAIGGLPVARVFVSGPVARELTGGAAEIEVAADTVGRLIRELDRHFPGLGRQVEESMAVAIDGVICQDTLMEPISSDSEVHLIPKIAGG